MDPDKNGKREIDPEEFAAEEYTSSKSFPPAVVEDDEPMAWTVDDHFVVEGTC